MVIPPSPSSFDFYGYKENKISNSLYVGSYGRGTAIHLSDVDIVYVLPYETYLQYNKYSYNGQSALLQAVKNSINKTYPTSDVGADGQVIDLLFSDGIKFEIVPCFNNTDNSLTFPDSNDGGLWRTTNPRPEIQAIHELDAVLNGSLRHLCRMVRAWKDTCNVPIGGLLIDTLTYNFIKDYQYRDKSYSYYGLFTLDFFDYLSKVNDRQAYWHAVGSNQLIYPRGSFSYKASCAYLRACEAIDYETKGFQWSANQKWREIYGTQFPI